MRPIAFFCTVAATVIVGVAAAPPAHAEDYVPHRVLVRFERTASVTSQRDSLRAVGAGIEREFSSTRVLVLRLADRADERSAVAALRSRRGVEFAELDAILAPGQLSPNDPFFANWQAQLRTIRANYAWLRTTGSSSIVVAILDTGVYGAHEDLAGKMVPGWNVYNNNSDTSDVYGHGTKVAGTAAAKGNNGLGVASVAWNCKIMPIRISDSNGYASYSTIASGLNWAADRGARVANVSYEASDSAAVRSSAQYFMNRGGVVTMSAGNNGLRRTSSNNPYVITVSATDAADQLYSWSNYGTNIDIAAPGTSYTTSRSGGYTSASGTSFSAPTVAGVAALVLSANPGLTGADAQSVILASGSDFGLPGWDEQYGWGRIDAADAVDNALNGSGGDNLPPSITISQPTNGQNVQGVFTVAASISDNVGVDRASLYVDGVLQSTLFASPFSWSVDGTRLSAGSHTLRIVARDYAGNESSAQVSVNVLATDNQPPIVVITNPTGGERLGTSLTVYSDARDNVRVQTVELWVGGKRVATSSASPFTTTWNCRNARRGTHTLKVKAIDPSGNYAWSQEISVVK